MSKDEAWEELEETWFGFHMNMHGGDCNCDELFEQIKEILSV